MQGDLKANYISLLFFCCVSCSVIIEKKQIYHVYYLFDFYCLLSAVLRIIIQLLLNFIIIRPRNYAMRPS